MVSDTVYEACQPVLQDESIGEEDKADKLEELLKKDLELSGKALEDAVLGALWKWRGIREGNTIPAPIRTTVIRRPSPAPWQLQRTGTPSLSSSPRSLSGTIGPPPGFGIAPPIFKRSISSTTLPSPRPSPRLAHATTQIPHSPSLNAYQFSEHTASVDSYDDYGSDNVDWLVNDDASSTASYGDSGIAFSLGGTPSEFIEPVSVEMSPYDMLRSILREDRTDEELAKALELNGYDLSQTIMSLMETQDVGELQPTPPEASRTYLVGKSLLPTSRPVTPSGQAKSPIVCRYFLASGHCARADCRFSHDLTNHICKYWIAGNCLAGDACMFSHDPSNLMSRMTVDGGTPAAQDVPDLDSFPSLQPTTSNPYESDNSVLGSPPRQLSILAQSAMNPFANFVPSNPLPKTDSRPVSRQPSRAATPSAPAFNDDEAFPTLGSAATTRSGKRHHGKRGHGHSSHKELLAPSSLAEVVRMSPAPSPTIQPRKGSRDGKSFTGSRENSAAAQAIPAPDHIPWLETGESANRAYLKARAEAFRHGGLRNKFLQSAAQAWNRNDARGAKALSMRGQNENTLMKNAHREAARILYEERNKNSAVGKELYVDLHGLHPEEAVSYLSTCLMEHTKSSRPVYAICGTGHHSKNGKDKVGKAVRAFLIDWRYAFREFSVPGDRNNVGGILGIDPSSFDQELAKKGRAESSEADSGVGLSMVDSKVRFMSAEEARAVLDDAS